MSKLYGYKERHVRGLIKCMEENEGLGKSKIFETYAKQTGKSKGTVRNMYYSLAKHLKTDSQLGKYFGLEEPISVHKIEGFSQVQERQLIENIVRGKMQNKSVRKVLQELSDGDEKLALRLQNKYRNILAKEREKVIEVAEEMGATHLFTGASQTDRKVDEVSLKRLTKEIDNLISRIGESLRRENKTLKEKLSKAEADNVKLMARLLEKTNDVKNARRSGAMDFFGQEVLDFGQNKR